jgi:hypothetical protein
MTGRERSMSSIVSAGRSSTRKAGHLYLGSGRPIWNNDGDTATLIDPYNIAVSRYRS